MRSQGSKGKLRWRRAGLLLVALGVLASNAVSAGARDLCMTFTGGGSWVFKRFKVPGADKCSMIQGFDAGGGGHGIMTGTACTEAGGRRMTFQYTAHSGGALYFETGLCWADAPLAPVGASAGRCLGQFLKYPDPPGWFAQNISLTPCKVEIPY